MSSSSSTDPAASSAERGTEIAGFRVENVLGRGHATVVYEATQIDFDRRVALKLLPSDPTLGERLRHLRWPEHPNVVSLYAAGVSEHGGFLAMQLVHGRRLAELGGTGFRQSAARALEDVAAALDAAHLAGTVHGAIRAQNVFIDHDGRGLLSDFGLGVPDATQADDLRAFGALVSEYLDAGVSDPLPPSAREIVRAALPARRPRRRWVVVGAALAVFAGAAALAPDLAWWGDTPKGAPAVLPGAIALGSELTGTAVDSLDCNGNPPSGTSEACSVVQTRLGGRPLVPRRSGVIRRWAVRGASGELALQVLRLRGTRFFMVARTQYAQIRDENLHVLPANLPVRAGDLVGLEVTPGAGIGVRRDVHRSETARWFGPIVLGARPADRTAGSGLDDELLLRVEYMPGAVWRPTAELTGDDAETAPAGRVISRVVQQGGGRSVSEVIRLGRQIAVDFVVGGRRITRLPVTNADPRGRLFSFDEVGVRFGHPIYRLRWSNSDGLVIHDYVVDDGSLTPLN